jgi:hypothetical protein
VVLKPPKQEDIKGAKVRRPNLMAWPKAPLRFMRSAAKKLIFFCKGFFFKGLRLYFILTFLMCFILFLVELVFAMQPLVLLKKQDKCQDCRRFWGLGALLARIRFRTRVLP